MEQLGGAPELLDRRMDLVEGHLLGDLVVERVAHGTGGHNALAGDGGGHRLAAGHVDLGHHLATVLV